MKLSLDEVTDNLSDHSVEDPRIESPTTFIYVSYKTQTKEWHASEMETDDSLLKHACTGS